MKRNFDLNGILGASLLLFCVIALQIFIGAVFYSSGYQYEAGDPLASGLLILLSHLAVVLTVSRHNGLNIKELFHPSNNSVSATITVLALPILVIAVSSVYWLSNLTHLMFEFLPPSENEKLALTRLTSGGMLSVLSICLIAPLFEELLFRGVILRGLLTRYPDATAILISATLFAIIHMTLTQLPVAYILGTFCGWLYLKTRSLLPAIMAHCFYNSFLLILHFIYQDELLSPEYRPQYNTPAEITLSVVATLGGLYVLRRIFNTAPRKTEL